MKWNIRVVLAHPATGLTAQVEGPFETLEEAQTKAENWARHSGVTSVTIMLAGNSPPGTKWETFCKKVK